MKSDKASGIWARHQDVLQLGTAIGFLLLAGFLASLTGANAATMPTASYWVLIVSTVVCGYMAMNIGANDVANNMGPAVGSGAMTLRQALLVAAVFEVLGALIAGGDVANTIKRDIVDLAPFTNPAQIVWLMLSALLAAALLLHVATALCLPVSTTHTIIGAIMGAGVAAGGWAVVNWGTMASIVLSWIVSPVLGGLVAAAFLYLIKRSITYRADMTGAAARVVPWLIAVMAWAFGTFMLIEGLGQLIQVSFWLAVLVGGVFAAGVWAFVRGPIARAAQQQDNNKEGVNHLFTWPLVCSAALLSFAHGANDVANAVGPLAAIYEAVREGAELGQATPPLWIMLVGGVGLAVGLGLFGARLIQTVGREITELDHMRAYAIAMSAALTVILASQLGMPVSTTHVAVGAIFGVGFLREMLKGNYAKLEALAFATQEGDGRNEALAYLQRFKSADAGQKKRMLAELKKRAKARELAEGVELDNKARKALRKVYKQELVKRSMVLRIAAAWVVTVPVTAVLAAVLFHIVAAVLG